MKRTVSKYILLIILTFIASIWIYEYIEKSKPIETENDILVYQKEIENNRLSDTNYTIENPNIILNPYGNSPLTALVVFQTKDLTPVTVTINGKDNGSDISHTFVPNKVHILPIYGLYPDYDNKVIIEASGIKKEITIKTEKLPDDFAIVTNTDNIDLDGEDLYFTTPEDKGYTAAYDKNGEVRWYLKGDYKWDIQRLNNGHILIGNEKLVRQPYYSIGLVEMDLLGKVYYEYNIPNGYHHSMVEFSNGNLLLSTNNANDETKEDYIVEVDRATGNIIKDIDLNKILGGKNKGNWFKISSLAYDSETNSLTISGYNSNMIINIDYSSLEINWIITDKKLDKNLEKYKLKGDFYPNKPESVVLISSSQFVFTSLDGDIRKLVEYKVNKTDKTFEVLNKIDLLNNENAYVEPIDDGYLVTQGNYIYEVNNGNNSTMTLNSNLYNSKRMPLYANDMFTGVQGNRFGVLGVTPTTNNHLLLSAKEDSSIIKKYNLSFHKDVYGLKFTGEFNKNDDVQLILDNVLSKKTYDIKLPDSDKKIVKTSEYITEDGLKGKYYIYIRINGKIYKLNKYALFY